MMLGKIAPLKEKNLFEVYENNVNRNPSSVLIEAGNDTYTYGHLNSLIATIYNQVRNLNVGKGNIVSVFIPNGVKRVACVLALVKLGIPFVPLDPLLPKVKIEHIFEKTQPRFIIVGGEHNYPNLWKQYDINDVNIVYLSDLLVSSSRMTNSYMNGINESEEVKLSDIFIILPTSGSTGAPKLVQLSHACLLNRCYWYWDEFPFGINEVNCSKTNFIFIDWSIETLYSVLQNQTCVFMKTNDVIDTPKLIKYLSVYDVTRFVTVPSVLRALIDEKRETNIDLCFRHITSGSDMLPTKIVKDFFETFPTATLCNLLGCTESSGDNIAKIFRSIRDVNLDLEYASVGYPMHNMKVRMWDEKCQDITAPNVTGELLISGPCISPGYLNLEIDPGVDIETHPATLLEKHNTCRMNDFAYFSEKDGFIMVGRKDRVIKIRGQKVDLTEVERAIEDSFPNIGLFVTSKIVKPQGNMKIVAFCAVGQDKTITRRTVMDKIKSKLPNYMLPNIIIIDSLPLNPISLKLDRLKLSKMMLAAGTTIKSLSDGDVLALPIPQRVLLIASYILGEDLNVDDMDSNFVELGGDSGSMRRFSKQLKYYGMNVEVLPIITGKTMNGLAIHAAEKQQAK